MKGPHAPAIAIGILRKDFPGTFYVSTGERIIERTRMILSYRSLIMYLHGTELSKYARRWNSSYVYIAAF